MATKSRTTQAYEATEIASVSKEFRDSVHKVGNIAIRFERARKFSLSFCHLSPLLLVGSIAIGVSMPSPAFSAEKKLLAVTEFDVSESVQEPDLGRSISDMLISRLENRYRIVERTQITKILAEHDLVLADVISDVGALKGKKLSGIDYLVVGNVARIEGLYISARLLEVNSGIVVQSADVYIADSGATRAGADELASVLQMSREEKLRHLATKSRDDLVSLARRLGKEKEYDAAMTAYRTLLDCRFDEELQKEQIALEKEKVKGTVKVIVRGSGCVSHVMREYRSYRKPILLIEDEWRSASNEAAKRAITALIVYDGFLSLQAFSLKDKEEWKRYVSEYSLILVLGFSGDGLSYKNRTCKNVHSKSYYAANGDGIIFLEEKPDAPASCNLDVFDEVEKRVRVRATIPVVFWTREYKADIFDSITRDKIRNNTCKEGKLELEISGPYTLMKK
ncbi:MAG TPA: FlgO family outer membrane protein [Phycisphaerae bacterium]|nr:FlgO family outer membrane protein [Phycisphaerae bacterium]